MWKSALLVAALAASAIAQPIVVTEYSSSSDRTITEALRFQSFARTILVDEVTGTIVTRKNNYALRVRTLFVPPSTGNYRFSARCDDGCKVFIEGTNVLPTNAYRYQGPRTYTSGDIWMVAGREYDYRADWFQGGGGVAFELKYTTVNTTTYNALTGSVVKNPDALGGNWVKADGILYATLDGAPAENALDGGCQDTAIAIPSGWARATKTESALLLLSRFNFGTSCLFFADGTSVYVGTAARGLPAVDATRCSATVTTATSGSETTYGVSACAARILVQKTAPSWNTATDYGASAGLGEPISFEGRQYVPLDGTSAKAPSNFDTGCTVTPSKIPTGYRVAQANAQTFAAIAGSRNRFGSRCVVLADGRYYDTQTAQACSGLTTSDGLKTAGANNDLYYPNACPARILMETTEQRPASTHRDVGCIMELANDRSNKVNRRFNDLTPAVCAAYCRSQNLPYGAMYANNKNCYCSDVKPKGEVVDSTQCCVSCPGNTALLCGGNYQSSTPRGWPATTIEVGYVNTNFSSSWDTSPVLGASVVRAKHFYATLDNAAPQECTSGCQGASYQLPTGWEIVPANDTEIGPVLQANTFATDCYVLADGSSVFSDGSACASGVLTMYTVSGSVFYAVSKCNSRILVRKARPTDVTGVCAAASGTGDPHYRTFDNERYTNHDEGEYQLVAPTEIPSGYDAAYNNWRVHAVQRRAPPTRAGVNEAIIIKQGATVLGVYLKNTNLTDPFQVHTASGEMPLTHNTWHEVGTPNTADHVRFYFKTGSGSSSRWGARYSTWSYADFRLASGLRVVVRSGMWHISYLNAYVYLPNRWGRITNGLLGNCDGVASNDFEMPSKDIATSQATFVAAYKVGTNSIPSIAPLPFNSTSGASSAPFGGCGDATAAIAALATQACASISDAGARGACEFDVCATGDADAAADAIRNAATERTLALEANGTCTDPTSSLRTFSKFGRTYALLDGSEASATTSRCTVNSYTVPTGWAVAEDIPVNRALLPCFTWGGGCVVYANGKAYDSDMRLCGADQLRFLAPAASAPDAVCYGTVQRNRHVLIVKQEMQLTITNGDFVDVLPSGAVTGWTSFPESTTALSYSRIDNPDTATPLDGALKVVIAAGQSGGAVQEASFSPARTESFSISAFAKVDALTAGVAGDFSLYVDVTYSNGNLGTAFADFSHTTTTTWHRRVVDINIPAGMAVSKIRTHVLVRNRVGTVYFANVVAGNPTGAPYNLLKDAHVESAPTGSEWLQYFQGWATEAEEVSAPSIGGTSAIGVRSTDPTHLGGAYQGVTFSSANSAVTGLYLGGYSRAWDTRSTISPDYSMYADVTLTQAAIAGGASHAYGLVAPFPVTTSWTLSDRVFAIDSSVASVSVNALFRKQPAGTRAAFDDMWLLNTCSTHLSQKASSGGFTYGDPHLISFAGAAFDVQTPGEYTLVSGEYINAQARFELAGNSVASVTTATAIRFGAENGGLETIVEIKRNPAGAGNDPIVRITPAASLDEAVSTLQPGASVSNTRGVTVTRSGKFADGPVTYTIRYTADQYTGSTAAVGTLTNTEEPVITQEDYTVQVVVMESASRVQFLQVDAKLPATEVASSGLLGSLTQDNTHFYKKDGSVLVAPTETAIETDFAASWRNTDLAYSNFDYNPAEGDKANPLAYFDPLYTRPNTGSFSAAERAAAASTCSAVTSTTLKASCEKDALYLASSSDAESFTTVAYGQASVDNRADSELPQDNSVSPAASVATSGAALVGAAMAALFALRPE